MPRLDPIVVPFWTTTTMLRESAMLRGSEDAASATLLWRPDVVADVTTAAGDVTFREGVDYMVEREQRRIVRIAGSRMPRIEACPADGTSGALTHTQTIAISYTHAVDRALWRPEAQLARLPHLGARFLRREPVTVCVSGDSISAGYDVSAIHQLPPFQPAFATLAATALEGLSGAPVYLHNLAVPGWTAADGLWEAERMAQLEPDLVIVGFGMNDASYADGDEFGANISTLLERVRARHAPAEFLLVSPMLPTPECSWVVPARFAEYQESLEALCGEGVAFTDVTGLWRELSRLKPIHDLSGNGLNHPNDFGHRLYAQAIIATLWPDIEQSPASSGHHM